MTKKFFSLIRNGTLRLAPKTKIIPQTEIEAMLEGHEVLEKIKKDAEDYRLQIAQDCEAIKAQA